MVRIRFRRIGLKKQPTYRIVVTDQRRPRNGGFLEVIGHHNPRTRPDTDIIDEARALYWLSVGAQPSDAVQRLMKRTGTWERFERLRKGEHVEKLVDEATAAQEAAEPVDPRTRYPSPAPGQGKNATAAAATLVDDVVAEKVEAVAEPVEEAVEAVAEAVEEEVEAVAEVVEEVAETVTEEPEAVAEAEVEADASEEAAEESVEDADDSEEDVKEEK
jgi:small subunit ribosomal protein S16